MTFSISRRFVPLLLASLFMLASVPAAGRELILVVNVDTLRADRLGVYGNPRQLTPAIDRLARDGIVFESAFATSNHTRPSVASLFTGLYPSEHGFWWESSIDIKTTPNLETLLAGQGFYTIWVNANPNTRQLARGFDSHWGEWAHGDKVYHRAEFVFDKARELLEEASEAPRVFLYVQPADPHGPYTPESYPDDIFEGDSIRANFDTEAREVVVRPGSVPLTSAQIRNARNRYDAEVREMDASLGRFVHEAMAGFDRVLFLFTADHGESFFERGAIGHGSSLYDSEIRVPLVMATKPRGFTGRTPLAVSHIDVLPTILKWAGSSARPRGRGIDLTPFLDEAFAARSRRLVLEVESRTVISETRYPFDAYWESHFPNVRTAGLNGTPLVRAVIVKPSFSKRVFKVFESDPFLPEHGLIPAFQFHPGETWECLANGRETPARPPVQFRKLVAEATQGLPDLKPSERALTAEEKARLRALGYVK